MTLGLERYQWMESARPEFRAEDGSLSDDYDYRSARSNAAAELAKACSESEAGCLHLLESEEETVEQWLANERWLLDRYRSLLDMAEFREAIPFELLAPLPSYGMMLDGQRLHIADAWQSASESDAEAVRGALERDLVYWRMVLKNSDALITNWYDGNNAIVFYGLEPHERSWHKIIY